MPRKDRRKSSGKIENVCVFCNLSEDNELKFGKIYEHNGIVTHYYCLLLSANMQQRGSDEEGILGFLTQDIQNELKRGKRLVCSYCKKSGATLGCCNTKCKRIFHYPCGLKAGSLHQFFGEFRSYCVHHRPKSKPEERFRAELRKEIEESPQSSTCYICLEAVDRSDKFQTLWASCCKKNAWFHRDCIQQLAMSAGYFFKCPMCNNKKEFQKAMLDRGIFIPCQDASWELVPHAFEELLYRHNRCDARICRCPKGREHSGQNAKWELILCRTCGSQGIHVACGQLKWMKPNWECGECKSILKKSKANDEIVENPQNRSSFNIDSTSNSSFSTNSMDSMSKVESQLITDDEDSDSDISVGIELPVFSELTPSSSGNMRPGPRSFKKKQQEELNKRNSGSLGGSGTNEFIGIRPETDDSDSDEEVIVLDSDNDTEKNKKPPIESNQSISVEDSHENISETSKILEDTIPPKPQEICANQDEMISDDESGESPIICKSISVQEFEKPFPETSFLRDTLCSKKTNKPQESSFIENPQLNHELNQQSTSAIIVPLKINENLTIENSGSSVMNIKITNVTSLPPEIFNWGSEVQKTPEVMEESENIQEQSSMPTGGPCKIPKPLKIGTLPETDSENEEISYQLLSTASENKIRSISPTKRKPETSEIENTTNELPNELIFSNYPDDSLNIEPQKTKKRKLNNSNVSNGFRNPINSKNKSSKNSKNKSLHIYQNGISMENVAVVSVLGSNFVVPLDVNPPRSDEDLSNNLNYNGDAGTKSAADICSEREITRCGNNRAKSENDDDGSTEKGFQRQKPSSSSSSATGATYNNPARIMNGKMSLKDLKFRVGAQNNVEITICDSYIINVNLDTVEKPKNIANSPKRSRQFEESSLVRGYSSNDKTSGSRSNQDPTSLPEDSNRSRSLIIESKDAVKENMAPAAAPSDSTGRFSSPDKKSKRLRNSSNDSTNSDDSRREFSQLVPSPKLESISQNCPRQRKNIKYSRRQSFNGFNTAKDGNSRFRVSIELSRIQPFFDSNPNLLLKHNNLRNRKLLGRSKSMTDLNNCTSTDSLKPGLLRRAKSFENISSIPNSKNMENRDSVNFMESQEWGKRRKTINFEKYDCIR